MTDLIIYIRIRFVRYLFHSVISFKTFQKNKTQKSSNISRTITVITTTIINNYNNNNILQWLFTREETVYCSRTSFRICRRRRHRGRRLLSRNPRTQNDGNGHWSTGRQPPLRPSRPRPTSPAGTCDRMPTVHSRTDGSGRVAVAVADVGRWTRTGGTALAAVRSRRPGTPEHQKISKNDYNSFILKPLVKRN